MDEWKRVGPDDEEDDEDWDDEDEDWDDDDEDWGDDDEDNAYTSPNYSVNGVTANLKPFSSAH